MPTYEYRCPKGHEFERFQRMSEPPVATCPECGTAAERLLSAGAGLIFKGSGFYITDYRSESYKKAAEADKANGAGSSAAGGSDGKHPSKGSGPAKAETAKSDAAKGESASKASSTNDRSQDKTSGSSKAGGTSATGD